MHRQPGPSTMHFQACPPRTLLMPLPKPQAGICACLCSYVGWSKVKLQRFKRPGMHQTQAVNLQPVRTRSESATIHLDPPESSQCRTCAPPPKAQLAKWHGYWRMESQLLFDGNDSWPQLVSSIPGIHSADWGPNALGQHLVTRMQECCLTDLHVLSIGAVRCALQWLKARRWTRQEPCANLGHPSSSKPCLTSAPSTRPLAAQGAPIERQRCRLVRQPSNRGPAVGRTVKGFGAGIYTESQGSEAATLMQSCQLEGLAMHCGLHAI